MREAKDEAKGNEAVATSGERPKDAAADMFMEWFCHNYPADVVIHRPEWHAPKIYRTATYYCQSSGRLAAFPILLAAVYAALEFAEDHEDIVDGLDGFPRPNRAMSLAQKLREALAAAGETNL